MFEAVFTIVIIGILWMALAAVVLFAIGWVLNSIFGGDK